MKSTNKSLKTHIQEGMNTVATEQTGKLPRTVSANDLPMNGGDLTKIDGLFDHFDVYQAQLAQLR